MGKKSKIPQVYGYAVCIVAIITTLICTADLITNAIDASDPLYAWGDNKELSSFENFKVDALKSGKNEASYVPDDETLRLMYEDAKNHKIRRVKHQNQVLYCQQYPDYHKYCTFYHSLEMDEKNRCARNLTLNKISGFYRNLLVNWDHSKSKTDLICRPFTQD